MKKAHLILLVLVLLAGFIVGCGDNDDKTDGDVDGDTDTASDGDTDTATDGDTDTATDGDTETDTATDGDDEVDTSVDGDDEVDATTDGDDEMELESEVATEEEAEVEAEVETLSCTGTCDSAESDFCLDDGTLCYCSVPDSKAAGTWTELECSTYCDYYSIESDGACVAKTNSNYCDCPVACTDTTGVASLCTAGWATACTCDSSDPCSWSSDSKCSLSCMLNYPDSSFDDSTDCEALDCSNATTVEGYCTDGILNKCTCASSNPCEWKDDGFCDVQCKLIYTDYYNDDADCNLSDCTNATDMADYCTYGVYNSCTCSASDPCGWKDDGYCDATCKTAFSSDYFDDSSDCSSK